MPLRYLRAFVIALRLTLRGEALRAPRTRAPAFDVWLQDGLRLLQTVWDAADGAGLDRDARREITVRVDGRDVAVDVLLAGIHYHLAVEYPHLLRHGIGHSLTAIHAGNLNDRYGLSRLGEAQAISDPDVLAAIAALRRHLDAIPPAGAD